MIADDIVEGAKGRVMAIRFRESLKRLAAGFVPGRPEHVINHGSVQVGKLAIGLALAIGVAFSPPLIRTAAAQDKSIVLDIWHFQTHPPGYFDIEEGTLASVAAKDRLYEFVDANLKNYSVVISKYDARKIDAVANHECAIDDPGANANARMTVGVFTPLIGCIERHIRSHSSEIASELRKNRKAAYVDVVAYWNSRWKPGDPNSVVAAVAPELEGMLGFAENWLTVAVIAVSPSGEISKSETKIFMYGYGYEDAELKQRNLNLLWKEMAPEMAALIRSALSR